MISAAVAPEYRGSALGLHVIGGSSSYFLSPLIGAAIATAFGWRWAFAGLAIPGVIFGIVFYVAMGRRIKAKTAVSQKTPLESADRSPREENLRQIIFFLILSVFTSAILTSVISYIPLLMVDRFHVTEKTAAAFLAVIYSTGLWAAPLGGYVSDRLGKIPVILAICFAAGPAIYLINHIPFGGGFAFGTLLLLIGMILLIRMPVSESYLVEKSPARYRSTLLGIYFFAAIEGGGVLTPVMGYLIDHFGFDTSLTIAGASVAIMALFCSFFLRTNPGESAGK